MARVLTAGTIVWLKPEFAVGREQTGRRPGVVVSSARYSKLIPELLLVVPLTTKDRSLSHHIRIEADGLKETSWAMCEQLRAFSSERVAKVAGEVTPDSLHEILRTCHMFVASTLT